MTSGALSRRGLLKGTAALAALGAASPAFGFAEGLCSAGGRRVMVLLNLVGGMDDITAYPQLGEAHRTVSALRPGLAVPEADVVPLTSRIGLNRRLVPAVQGVQSLRDLHLQESAVRFVTRAGFRGSTFSHNDDQNVMSAGAVDIAPGLQTGWLARLVGQCGTPVYSFGSQFKIDFNVSPSDPQPYVFRSLRSASFEDRPRSLGGREDSDYARHVARQIAESRSAGSDVEARLLASVLNMYRSVDQIKEIAATPVSDLYPTNEFGTLCKDVARVITHKAANAVPGPMIVYLQLGGFDTHSNQAAALGGLLDAVGRSLPVLVDDLKKAGMWQDTVIYQFSEFGRTVRENGSKGTDHASASTHMVLGGRVAGGGERAVSGPGATAAELTHERNHLVSEIDFRNVLRECLVWTGLPSATVETVFSERYPRTGLGLFRA